MMRLSNVKTLLCCPSRMQIYGFVENHTFLEQFVSMGVPAHFSNLGVPAHYSNIGVPAHFSILWLCWPSRMHIYGSIDPQLEGCKIELFWPIDSTHDETPKRKNIALLPL